jgi:SAM-dependent methyltransferase
MDRSTSPSCTTELRTSAPSKTTSSGSARRVTTGARKSAATPIAAPSPKRWLHDAPAGEDDCEQASHNGELVHAVEARRARPRRETRSAGDRRLSQLRQQLGRAGLGYGSAVRDQIKANRTHWDSRTTVHVGSAFYDVKSFKAGRDTLNRIEVEELGDVTGKRLLHLQCHFGLDTLSWARRGAKAVGADFSPKSISVARELADELRLDAKFVCADVNELPSKLDDRFDIVFTSYGVLAWLPDLREWAHVIAHFLDEDGVFYIVENHPFAGMLSERDGILIATDPYFDIGPIEVPPQGTYAEPEAVVEGISYQWQHSLGDIVSALTGVGLRIEFLHEFSFTDWQRLPAMVESEEGTWRLPGHDVPLLFSLMARNS